ncbi:hypothetical protein D0Z00_001258 [Geotrichum galactomycetum]|uniref:Uncharacterized protein n=1 Tax=Geotrichum galactomycetum TaxID=27317 RepID=A0ACB6V7S6_9ASCO|nr:hypothetical protein D0Z00_001258 [Geotrichum candidum]
MIELSEETYKYLNWFLISLIILSIARRLFFSKDTRREDYVKKMQQGDKKPVLFKDFTPTVLAKFNGEGRKPVLMAVKGDVLDVTAGKSFYGPGGPYSNFAGRDASRGLAKNSFDDDVLTPLDEPIDTLEDLTAEEKEALDEWHTKLKGKYIHVGRLVNETAKTK